VKKLNKWKLTITVEEKHVSDIDGSYFYCYDDGDPNGGEAGETPVEAFNNYMGMLDQNNPGFKQLFQKEK
jgi:hypothetical protein